MLAKAAERFSPYGEYKAAARAMSAAPTARLRKSRNDTAELLTLKLKRRC
jgi:hypothetical protein